MQFKVWYGDSWCCIDSDSVDAAIAEFKARYPHIVRSLRAECVLTPAEEREQKRQVKEAERLSKKKERDTAKALRQELRRAWVGKYSTHKDEAENVRPEFDDTRPIDFANPDVQRIVSCARYVIVGATAGKSFDRAVKVLEEVGITAAADYVHTYADASHALKFDTYIEDPDDLGIDLRSGIFLGAEGHYTHLLYQSGRIELALYALKNCLNVRLLEVGESLNELLGEEK